MLRLLVVAPLILLAAADCGEPAEPPTLSSLRETIFVPRCGNSACHGGSNPARGLDLATDPFAALVGVPSEEDPAVLRVVAGDPAASLLFQVLEGDVGAVRQMPPGFELPAEDVEAIRAWIAAGAAND